MLAGAQWRDSWLHGFRSLYLLLEVILLGLAGGLLVSILTLEVSRAWVPAVLLLVDAYDGPQAQTRFVLRKALQHGLKVIIVVNKIDRENSDPAGTYNKVLELEPNYGPAHINLGTLHYNQEEFGQAVGRKQQAIIVF